MLACRVDQLIRRDSLIGRDVNYGLNFSSAELYPLRRERFLGMALPVPHDVDAVLERQYGARFLSVCQGGKLI